MWYFTWVLGLAFACAFGVLNAMWLEMRDFSREPTSQAQDGKQAE